MPITGLATLAQWGHFGIFLFFEYLKKFRRPNRSGVHVGEDQTLCAIFVPLPYWTYLCVWSVTPWHICPPCPKVWHCDIFVPPSLVNLPLCLECDTVKYLSPLPMYLLSFKSVTVWPICPPPVKCDHVTYLSPLPYWTHLLFGVWHCDIFVPPAHVLASF